MNGREFGFRLAGLFLGGLMIFGFFGCLMSATEGMGRSAIIKKQHQDAALDLPLLLNALRTYATTHGGKFPEVTSAADLKRVLYPDYIATEATFLRLGDKAAYQPNKEIAGKSPQDFTDPDSVIALSEPNAPPITKRGPTAKPTRAVVYLSGRFERIPAENSAP
jgi:hypothetical protein